MIYKEVVVSICPDCGPNTGGYYCVVSTRNDECEIDDFCIHPDELAINPDLNYWIMDYMENVYDSYVREGSVQKDCPGSNQGH